MSSHRKSSLKEKFFVTNFFSLLHPTPPTKCFALKFANQPCCKFICGMFVFTAVLLSNKSSLTLFLLQRVALHSLNEV